MVGLSGQESVLKDAMLSPATGSNPSFNTPKVKWFQSYAASNLLFLSRMQRELADGTSVSFSWNC